ncbi:MAG: ABC transporter ATP-binding protein [Acutalibacteraceae bacterium]|nr:ABC transporter ATP-binding protein [Acutalibacteraceae bacterium]
MKNNTLKWLFSVAGRKKGYILLLILVQILHGASGVLYALLLRNIVDSAVEKNTDIFVLNVSLVILLVIAQLSMRAVIRFLNELSRASLENTLKERMMKHLLNKNFAAVDAVHSGEWLNRLTNDTVVVANGYAEILPGVAGMTVKMISAVIMIILLQPWFAWIMLPGGVVMVILTYAFRKVLKRLHKNVQEKDGSLRIFLQETLGNMMMIRSFAAEQQTEKEMIVKTKEHKAARMRKNRFSNFCNIGFGTAIQGMYLFGICWCGWGILMGTITLGTLTAVTQLISQIQSPFANITGYLPKFYAMTASAERLMEIESFDEETTEPLLASDEVAAFYRDDLQEIGLKNVRFTYYPPSDKVTALTKDGMPVVLNDINLIIRKGEYVAFTGHSGCGKSTVIKLLMSIYRPDAGECFIRTANGTKALTSRYHRLFAYVPQGNKLMTGTVREAVAFADKTKMQDDEKITQALKIACADTFVSELENGIDTLLGERGTGLSEGQTQRIAVARAIFSDSPVLILDEATSSLDAVTEKKLLENLRKMTDKTVIIVTHRPAALTICDRVLKFTENGVEEV